MLNVIELSRVIQGEGKFMGKPSLLIRMTNCNLHCIWCDSKQASWNAKKGKFTLNQIEDFIAKNPDIKYLFITGGNPTDTRNIKDLKAIISLVKSYGKFVYIEDNGTNYTEGLYLDFVSLSPKLSGSIPVGTRFEKNHKGYLKRQNTSLKQWNSNYDCQFKFVITEKADFSEMEFIVRDVGIKKDQVYLMPEGTTMDELNRNRKMVYGYALKQAYNYTERLHIVVYGNQEGI